MDSERFVSELKSIRQKYSQSVFELGKSKDEIKKLKSEKTELYEKYKNSKEVISKLEKEKKYISIQLEEALKNIADLREKFEINDKKTGKNKKIPRELRQLGNENNILKARLKQAEFGIKQCEDFQRSNETEDDVFEVESILAHKGKGRHIRYLVRWQKYGPDHDTWEPECNLDNCKNMLERYKRQYNLN